MAQRSAAAEDIVSSFKKILETDVAVPVAAMNSLVYYIVVWLPYQIFVRVDASNSWTSTNLLQVLLIKKSNSTTWMELEHELSRAINSLKDCGLEDLGGRTNISLGSGCDLFMKYVTKAFKMEYMVS